MGKARLRPEQWLLIEWPANNAEPSKYVLSTLPEGTPINKLVSACHQRWRIERDYQDLKTDCGQGHNEGRGWRGFHHHAALSIAAYGLLMAERLAAGKSVNDKKTSSHAKCLPFPRITSLGAVVRAAARGDLDHNTAPPAEPSTDRPTRAVPLLRQRKAALVTP